MKLRDLGGVSFGLWRCRLRFFLVEAFCGIDCLAVGDDSFSRQGNAGRADQAYLGAPQVSAGAAPAGAAALKIRSADKCGQEQNVANHGAAEVSLE